VALDPAAKRALFDALGPSRRALRDAPDAENLSQHGHPGTYPGVQSDGANRAPARSAGAGGLVLIEQVGEKRDFHRGNSPRPAGSPSKGEGVLPNNYLAPVRDLDDLAPGGGPSAKPPGAFGDFGQVIPAHQLRGRWMSDLRYARLRNAAWMVRNSRTGQMNNPLALEIVRTEAVSLIEQGEKLSDIIEALAELLVHP